MSKAGFEIAEVRQFNRFASLGWFVRGKLLGKAHIGPGSMAFYDMLLPLAKVIEALPIWPAMSLIVVGQKPAAGKPVPAGEDKISDHASSSGVS